MSYDFTRTGPKIQAIHNTVTDPSSNQAFTDAIGEIVIPKYTNLAFDSVSNAISEITSKNYPIGSKLTVEDYYGGATPNNSGVLFFKVVPSGTGVNDGGKYIDVDSNRQLEQNIRNPINPRAWGARFNGSDVDNNPVQLALDYKDFSTTIIDGPCLLDVNKPGTYTHAINIPSNRSLIINSNVTILPNGLDVSAIFLIDVKENVHITGNGTVTGDSQSHTGSTGEGGMGFIVYGNSDRVTIDGLTVEMCWGDGVYTGAGVITDKPKRLRFTNLNLRNNRRNNMSITAGERVFIQGCEFSDAGSPVGTAPKAGLDIEPNITDVISEVIVDNCIARNNPGGGVGLFKQDDTDSRLENVSLSNIITTGNGSELSANGGGGIRIRRVTGSVSLHNVISNGDLWDGVALLNNNTNNLDLVELKVSNIQITNPTNRGMWIEGSSLRNIRRLNMSNVSVLNAGADGLYIRNVRESVINGVLVRNATEKGAYILDTNETRVLGFNSIDAGDSGLRVQSCDKSYFSGIISGSATYSLDLPFNNDCVFSFVTDASDTSTVPADIYMTSGDRNTIKDCVVNGGSSLIANPINVTSGANNVITSFNTTTNSQTASKSILNNSIGGSSNYNI